MLRPVTTILLFAAIIFAACSPGGDTRSHLAPTFCPTHLAQSLEVAPETDNIAPRAYYQHLSTNEDTALSITLYACDPNDVDTSEGLSWMMDTGPLSGNLSTTAGVYPDAVISYFPQRGFTGTDSFIYHVNDGLMDGNPAEVLITVEPEAATAGSTWVSTYPRSNDVITRDIQEYAAGGYLITGTIYGTPGGTEYWTAKLDPLGDVVWERDLGGGIGEYAWSGIPASDGGAALTGQSQSFGQGSVDMWVVKLDSGGNLAWEQAFGTSGQEYSYGILEARNALGAPDGFAVLGYQGSPATSVPDLIVLRLNANGSMRWQRRYDAGDRDTGGAIDQTADSGFVIAGSSLSFAGSGVDVWVLKLDTDGDIVWQRSIGTDTADERVRSIRQAVDGGYIIGGKTWEFDANGDMWVVKLDASGDILWQKSLGGAGADEAYSVQGTGDGGSIVVGTTDSFTSNDDAWVLKLDADGAVDWQYLYDGGGIDQFWGGGQTANGGYIATGGSTSFGSGGYDPWIVRLDSNGQLGALCDLGTSPLYSDSATNAVSTSTAGTVSASDLLAEASTVVISTSAGPVTILCGGQ